MLKLERGITLTKLIHFFFRSYSGDLLIIPNKLTKYQCPSSNSFQDILLKNLIMSQCMSPKKEHNSRTTRLIKQKGKIQVSSFSILIPYIKFQSLDFDHSWPNAKLDEWTDRWMDEKTKDPKALRPSNFFEVGGIKMAYANICSKMRGA